MSNAAKHDHGGAPAKNPCGSCPYRKDVPSGVWSESEYEKLPDYDKPTEQQPIAAFLCHQQDGRLCAGWVGCHDMEQSLAMRLAVPFGTVTYEALEKAYDYVSPVPLHESGQAAYEHGIADIDDPDEKARRTVEKLLKKIPGVVLHEG